MAPVSRRAGGKHPDHGARSTAPGVRLAAVQALIALHAQDPEGKPPGTRRALALLKAALVRAPSDAR
jgi:hypothetical protein